MPALASLRHGAAQGQGAVPALPPRRRRNWPLAVTGALVVAACTFIFAAGWLRAGDRQPVLALARPVAAGQPLAAADLQVVRVSVAGPVTLMPAADEASVLGRPAAAPLPAGALLTPGDLGPASPPPGQDYLGIAVKPGQYPPDLAPGQVVDVLATPAASASGGAGPALPVGRAVVLAVVVSPATGATVVELSLSQDAVPQVAAAAAAGQVSLATIPAGG